MFIAQLWFSVALRHSGENRSILANTSVAVRLDARCPRNVPIVLGSLLVFPGTKQWLSWFQSVYEVLVTDAALFSRPNSDISFSTMVAASNRSPGFNAVANVFVGATNLATNIYNVEIARRGVVAGTIFGLARCKPVNSVTSAPSSFTFETTRRSRHIVDLLIPSIEYKGAITNARSVYLKNFKGCLFNEAFIRVEERSAVASTMFSAKQIK